MPKPTFEWHPDAGATCAIKPSVHTTKFGDGYELRTSAQINASPEKWTVKFTRAADEFGQIDAFLKARGAMESFLWTTPEGNAGTYVCREWSKTRLRGGAAELSATFEQVFEY